MSKTVRTKKGEEHIMVFSMSVGGIDSSCISFINGGNGTRSAVSDVPIEIMNL